MSEVEQRREQLPSGRAREISGAAARDNGQHAVRAAKIRRSAWLLAGLALFFYLGFIAWTLLAPLGG